MDAAAARARLERMVAWDTSPRLSADEVDQLLTLAARPDAAGRLALSEGWEPTYNLYAAAAEGWDWKAGKVAGDPDFSADGATISAGKVHKQCLDMADMYAKKAAGGGTGGITSVRLSGTDTGRILPVDIVANR